MLYTNQCLLLRHWSVPGRWRKRHRHEVHAWQELGQAAVAPSRGICSREAKKRWATARMKIRGMFRRRRKYRGFPMRCVLELMPICLRSSRHSRIQSGIPCSIVCWTRQGSGAGFGDSPSRTLSVVVYVRVGDHVTRWPGWVSACSCPLAFHAFYAGPAAGPVQLWMLEADSLPVHAWVVAGIARLGCTWTWRSCASSSNCCSVMEALMLMMNKIWQRKL